MANTYFQFKQFTIDQDKCAMKVTTEACVFGAWIAKIFTCENNSIEILDVGTGTGLLALMLAQSIPHAKIKAVELDENAAAQAFENVQASPFASQIAIEQGDFNTYNTNQPFHLIISNPPFFKDSLKAPSQAISNARHEGSLTIDELMRKSYELTTNDGMLCLIVPYQREREILALIKLHGWHIHSLLNLAQTTKHEPFRQFYALQKTSKNYTLEKLIIRNDNGDYTPEFKNLLKPFYLFLGD